jgi:Fic family protein
MRRYFRRAAAGCAKSSLVRGATMVQGPMHVVSGPARKGTVHYEAPAAPLLEKDMSAFVVWADWALARSENSSQRFSSMSAPIRHERNDYYNILETTQKGTLDVTRWMEWFLACLGRAFEGTEVTLRAVLRKARFWEKYARVQVNDRQRDVINRLLDGFTGKLTTTKWAKLEKCSHDTALRDIQGLIEQGLLRKDPRGGRSTSYSLMLDR